MGGGCSREKKEVIVIDPSLKPIDAGRIEDYKKNEIKEVKVTSDFSVLVSEFDGKYYAYGSKCPHYGAPLIKGILLDGLIKCPWHGACFDIRTGEIEDYPGMDKIPSYQVTTSELGQITVYPSNYGVYSVERPLVDLKETTQKFIILGGGASALVAAQTLRENGYDGRIIMITRDVYLPYDRTKISKVLGIGWDIIKLKEEGWFKQARIEVMLNADIYSLDVEVQEVVIDGMDGHLEYNKILIATGMKPRIPVNQKSGVIGTDLSNVMALYDLMDSRRLKEKATGKTVVVIGAGFIAMEILGPLHAIANKVYVIHRSKRPYGMVLGDTIGRLIQQWIIQKYGKKITFIPCDALKQIYGNKNKEVTSVLTLKKRKINCDLVVFAMGGAPSTDYILPYRRRKEDEGFKFPHAPALGMNSAREIPVNEYMETHLINHYACGDVARFPCVAAVSSEAQAGHWGIAQKMGRTAALKMLGKNLSIYDTVPFFWTSVAGITVRYVGYGEHYNHSIIFGDLKSLKFCVLYKRGWKILAGCTCNCDPIAARLSFDIQDNVRYDDSFPSYITDVFPATPILGDTIFGLSYVDEDAVNEYDLLSHLTKRSWVPRRPKNFKHSSYKDIEYINKPLMSTYEKLYYKNAKHLPTAIARKEVTQNYDPIRLNFLRLQFYQQSRYTFAKDSIIRTRRPIYW